MRLHGNPTAWYLFLATKHRKNSALGKTKGKQTDENQTKATATEDASKVNQTNLDNGKAASIAASTTVLIRSVLIM